MMREYTKWDDQPMSLPHFAESAVRAYKLSMTLPMRPVVLVVDSELQEAPVDASAPPRIPKLTLDAPPQGSILRQSPKRRACSLPPKIPSLSRAEWRARRRARPVWRNSLKCSRCR